MTAALSAIFILSGAAALVFETLWFRQAGLMLGNSVWATSLVTASFMGGLALGNGLVARHGDRLRRPLLAYARLEVVIGVTGFGLVLLFPVLTPWLAPVLGRLLVHPGLLNFSRLVCAFTLMLIPATAMGATLPLLVRAVTARGTEFGPALGLLYGWNTLGAVGGALLGEMLLIERFGVRGTGLLAALFDVAAAGGALFLARRSGPVEPSAPAAPKAPLGRAERLLIAAAFVCGGLLLALEVVWFRFLLLFVMGTTLTFAVMLSVVLAGIALGGLVASAWLRWRPQAFRYLPLIALIAGITASQTYVGMADHLPGGGQHYLLYPSRFLPPAAYLMLPTSFLSGILFTFLGRLLKERTPGETRTAGVLTLANTTGAALGALLAGFVLLPGLGMERSFLLLAAGYGVVALLILLGYWPSGEGARREVQAHGLAALVFLALLAFFPLGLMRNHYMKVVASRWPTMNLMAAHEGLTETVLYLREDLWGEPFTYRLVTNGFSMSGTLFNGRRYMGLFAYLPLAIRPQARQVLLISYGVGNTAKALTDTRSLETIDIVDISRDIVEMSRLIFPPRQSPIDDPRVHVHVEDGRFFLLTTDRRYDLITAEPPPPRNAGIVNLYSREHFQLIHDRLTEGGLATYWLPVYQLDPNDAKGIIRGFCSAFADCTLWTGFGGEWMLLGSRGASASPPEEEFTRQWRDPVVGPTLQAVGLDVPEELGALFLADAAELQDLTRDVPPLDDDHPHRLSVLPGSDFQFFRALAPPAKARASFARSDFIRKVWPPGLRERSLPFFDQVEPLNRGAWALYGGPPTGLADLHAALKASALKNPALWFMEATEDRLRIGRRAAAQGVLDPQLDKLFGAEAMVKGDYLGAERRFRAAQRRIDDRERLAQWRALALCLAGHKDEASQLVHTADEWVHAKDLEGWAWLTQTFGLENPFPAPEPHPSAAPKAPERTAAR